MKKPFEPLLSPYLVSEACGAVGLDHLAAVVRP